MPVKKEDSLLLAIEKMPPDTLKVNQLFELCLSFSPGNVPEKLGQSAEEAILFSQKIHYTRGTGLALYVKGFSYYAQRNFQKALDTIAHARQILENCNDITNSGHCSFVSSHICYDMGSYPQVVINSEAALASWKKSSFEDLNGVCNNDMAIACIRMGKYSKAIEYAGKGYEISRRLKDKNAMAQSLQLMGSSFFDFKYYDIARRKMEEAAQVNLSLKDSFAFARNNNMLGEISLEQSNFSDAMKKFRLSFDIYSRPGAPAWGKPWGLSNIGSVYEKTGDSLMALGFTERAMGNYKMALDNYEQSLEQFQQIKDPAGSTEQFMLAGRTYFKTGNIGRARKLLTEGLALAAQIGEKRHLASSYLYLSKVDSAEGNMPGSYEHYKQHVLYRDSVFNLQSIQSLLMHQARLDAEKKDQEIALLETENKLQKALSEKKSQGRNFAFLLGGLAILGSGYGVYRYRRINKQKMEQRSLTERLAISQDLHDSIGSTLSSIAVYSQVAKIHGTNNEHEDMNELLEKISKASGETVTEMNDIVWALNPRNDSMEKIFQRMESFAKPLAAARNIHFNFSYNTRLVNQLLDMNLRKNLYLFFKEAVNNAIKYSASTELTVDITAQNEKMIMKIADNGVGFNVNAALKNNKSSLSGNGLINIQKRTAEMKGSLSIESQPGKGTELILIFPFTAK